MILSRYHYRPVTVPLPFLASVTFSPSSWHYSPSPSLTVPHRSWLSLIVPHRLSPSLTVPDRYLKDGGERSGTVRDDDGRWGNDDGLKVTLAKNGNGTVTGR